MNIILSENAIHDLAAPKFHYCIKEQNATIFRFKSNGFVKGGAKLFLPPLLRHCTVILQVNLLYVCNTKNARLYKNTKTLKQNYNIVYKKNEEIFMGKCNTLTQ